MAKCSRSAKFSTHSSKATTLVWCAKVGVAQNFRRTLGYHVAPKDQMVDLHARWEYNRPLEEFAKVIRWIISGHFQPDYCLHGRFLRLETMVFEEQNNEVFGPGDKNPALCFINLRKIMAHDAQATCEHQPNEEYLSHDPEGHTHVECDEVELQLAEPESEEER